MFKRIKTGKKGWFVSKRDAKIEKLANKIAQELNPMEVVVVKYDHIEKLSPDWGSPVDIKD